MSEATHVHRELQTGQWAEPNPTVCPCHGNGWFLSDYDAWYRCPLHGRGVPHPEDCDETFDYQNHLLMMFRLAFAQFRAVAVANGFMGDFTAACWEHMKTDRPTPANWVDAAEGIAVDTVALREDERALAEGYSCALEMRLHHEALRERNERA